VNILNDLEISCEYSSNGCKKYIKLGDLEVHINNCTLNPSKFILCECGLIIDSNDIIEHQNNCVKHFKNQLDGALELINDMNKRNTKLKEELKEAKKEFSIMTEWRRVSEISLIFQRMPQIKYEDLTKILISSLNDGIFNTNQLCQIFCNKFGGNWNIFIGHKLIYNEFNSENTVIYQIGKFNVIIFMNIKPVNDVRITEKLIKIIDDILKHYFIL